MMKSMLPPRETRGREENNVTERRKGAKTAPPERARKETITPLRRLLRFVLILLETVALLAVGVLCALLVATKGPSEAVRERTVMTLRETSALKFVPGLVLSQEEIAEIDNNRADKDMEIEEMDTSLVTITKPVEADPSEEPVGDAWGLVDEDGDGIVIDPVRGEGYNGYMMVVYDPSRVIMGCVPSSFEREGYNVAEMVEHFDAVAGINAGGFMDPGGMGNGATPDSMVVYEGQIYYAQFGLGQYGCFVGIDSDYKLRVGKFSRADVEEAKIQYGVCFGPALVVNGQPADPSGFASGLNPRTAIGQRSDGAMLMLVIDGRQATSLGASFQDVVDVMMSYGAVNACNLDGGSSSLLWFGGDYVNNKAHIVGVRDIPTSFVVLKEGVREDG